jgi:hypothetical protein
MRRVTVIVLCAMFVLFLMEIPEAEAGWYDVPTDCGLAGSAANGIEISSNENDDTGDEYLLMKDSMYTVFEASQGTNVHNGGQEYVDITSEDNIFLEFDADTTGGSLIMQSGEEGSEYNVFEMNQDGTMTLGGDGLDGDLLIQSSAGTTNFDVDGTTGNTDIKGTLDADGEASLDGGIDVNGAKFTVGTSGAVDTSSTFNC